MASLTPLSLKKKRLKYFLLLLFLFSLLSAYFLYRHLMNAHAPDLDMRKYSFELDTINSIRRSIKTEEKAEDEFVKLITQRVFPYWYGTSWDYNGTTETPRQGKIACGYFVTTTLRDMGVPINRVKMAQCASEEMIRALVQKKNIYHLSGLSLAAFEKKLETYGKGLYIIGLDNHTGFIWIHDTGNYFIHASGWFPFKVVRDKVGTSSVLERSKYRVVGKISADEGFLKSWINK
jgi:hypothetical protein